MAEETVAPAALAEDTTADDAASESPVAVESSADGEASSVAVADAPAPDAPVSDAVSVESPDPTPTPTVEAEPVMTTTTLEAASAATSTEGVPMEGSNEPKVTVGRIVHVTLDRGVNTGDCRPAIVARVWNPEVINAQLFTDGLNDHMDYAGGVVWITSLHYAKPVVGQPTPPLTWHWSWED